jgi:hypothetical protein
MRANDCLVALSGPLRGTLRALGGRWPWSAVPRRWEGVLAVTGSAVPA